MNTKKIFILSLILISFALFLSPVLSQNTNDYRALYSKANSRLVSGNFNEAIYFYNLAIQQNPKSLDAHLGLGIAYKESGRYQEAYEATMKVIELNPSYYQAYYNLGIVLENLDRAEEAIDAYEKFLKEIPGAERFSDAKQRILRLKKKYK
ncbi:MAG: hypothetical protein A2287_08135 [Candidatus Melainabacteria bacterium RIFOXYA12_FULL_32_12]|nr:MAG: hypothetical protein A2287_08135 [Candidatus Melainabacteria bacterium RIFOXYA12_FULL_32_12]